MIVIIITIPESRTGVILGRHQTTSLGWTSLLEAIILSNGGPAHVQIVQMLVDAGCKVNLADKDGVTPLAHARQRGFKEMAGILERAGAK